MQRKVSNIIEQDRGDEPYIYEVSSWVTQLCGISIRTSEQPRPQGFSHFLREKPWERGSSLKLRENGKKTFNLPCNIAGKKNCWKAMLLYLPLTFKPVLYQIRLLQVAWILTSDWIKLRGIHAIYGIYVTCCKKSLLSGSVCAACTDFVEKVELITTFCKNVL